MLISVADISFRGPPLARVGHDQIKVPPRFSLVCSWLYGDRSAARQPSSLQLHACGQSLYCAVDGSGLRKSHLEFSGLGSADAAHMTVPHRYLHPEGGSGHMMLRENVISPDNKEEVKHT